MRLFLAIELPDYVREHLADYQHEILTETQSIRLTRYDSLHLTLKFLGELPEENLPTVDRVLSETKVGGSLELAVTGITCFPDDKPIRIIAATLTGETDRLTTLHQSLENNLARYKVPKDKTPYKPHVTLARVDDSLHFDDELTGARRFREHLKQFGLDNPGPMFMIDHYVLMQSHLKEIGAEYEVIAKY